MKNALQAFCILIVVALGSCREQVAEYDNTLPRVEVNSVAASPAAADSTNVTNNNINQQVAPARTAATAALNPEHGKPGHRCDIAVGAPLNSPAASKITAPASSSPLLSSPGNSARSVGLNPPHGQPGHDCAIPVGQPLKG